VPYPRFGPTETDGCPGPYRVPDNATGWCAAIRAVAAAVAGGSIGGPPAPGRPGWELATMWTTRVDSANRQERRSGELTRSRPDTGTRPDWAALVHADRAYRDARTRLFAGDPVPALRAALASPDRDIALRVLYECDARTDVVRALAPELFAAALDPEQAWGAQVRTLLCRLDPATRCAVFTPLVHAFLAAGPVDADAVAGLLTLLHRARLTGLFRRVRVAADRCPYPEVQRVAAHWDDVLAVRLPERTP
jgi:hypothetical protein